MNIDERIEALTHSLELVSSMQMGNERRIAELAEQGANLQKSVATMQDSFITLRESVRTMADGMTELTRIVLNHHHRIDDLERGRQ